jgi:pimeloyl-ACP methyl ester carboxylesterase
MAMKWRNEMVTSTTPTRHPHTGTIPNPVANNRRWPKWLRIVRGSLLVVIALLAAGALYQAIMVTVDQSTYPAPGQLISVGDHALHIQCMGEGSPTVILEVGAGMMSAHWAWVQSNVAATSRVCAYDRAGSGWSEAGPAPRDAQQIATELHALLEQAEIKGPYVLVGHSIGGLYARTFAALYPDAVAGLVLVDSSHPEQMTRSPETKAEQDDFLRLFKWVPLMARLGIVRLAGMASMTTTGLPAYEGAAAATFFAATRQHVAMLAELAAWDSTTEQALAANLGDKPLFVVSAGSASSPEWREMQIDLLGLSSNNRQLVVEQATHQGLLIQEESAQMTSDAILQVVAAVRYGGQLATR